MALIDDVQILRDNIEILKKIHADNSIHNYNVTITGKYYTDVNTVLKDYANSKEQIALLLASSGSDSDKISELTALNNKANRELLICQKERDEYKLILDELINILKL